MVKTVVVAGFATLAARLGQMQLLENKEYSQQAKANVVNWKEKKPIRGLISDRRGRPLAENLRTWEVRIVPSELPKMSSPEWDGVRDRLITALRLPDSLIVDPESVPKDAKTIVYTRIARLLGYVSDGGEDIQNQINFINISAKYNYIVLVAKELTSDEAAKF